MTFGNVDWMNKTKMRNWKNRKEAIFFFKFHWNMPIQRKYHVGRIKSGTNLNHFPWKQQGPHSTSFTIHNWVVNQES